MPESFRGVIEKFLETVMFNKSHFSEIKELIARSNKGKIPERQVRERILEFRVEIFQELLDKITFYFGGFLKQAPTSAPDTARLKEQLKEREQLLEETQARVQSLFERFQALVRDP